MTAIDLQNLLERIQNWPEAAQDEIVAIANKIESELRHGDYLATRKELQMIDAAMASIDNGDIATDVEVTVAFAKFGPA